MDTLYHHYYCGILSLGVTLYNHYFITSSQVIPADEAFLLRLTIFKSDFLAVPSGLKTLFSLIVTFNRNLDKVESVERVDEVSGRNLVAILYIFQRILKRREKIVEVVLKIHSK